MSGRSIVRACLILGLVALGCAAYLCYDLVHSRTSAIENAKQGAREETVRAAARISEELSRLPPIVRSLTEDTVTEDLGGAGLNQRLESILRENPSAHGVGVAFAPSGSGSRQRLHAPSVVRKGESLERVRLEETHDYTDTDVRWYHEAIEGGAGWREPAWEPGAPSITAVYSAPLPAPSGGSSNAPAGVAYLSVSMESIKDWVEALDLGKTGWGLVASKQGYPLVHPIERLVTDHVSIFEIAKAANDQSLLSAAEEATSGQSGFLDDVSRVTGQATWFFYEPIPETGWSMVVAHVKDEILPRGPGFRRQVIWICISGILGLVGIAGSYAGSRYQRNQNHRSLWALVAFGSILLLVGIGVIRDITYDEVNDDGSESVTILDRSGLQSFLASQEAHLEQSHVEPPLYVPTGIFVENLKFTGPKEIFINGVVWQKFTDGVHDGVARGVVFRRDTQSSYREAYRRKQGKVETIGWRFEATLAQNLRLSRYPLDHETIRIRLWHKDLSRNVMLTPDLAAYRFTNPSSLPGLGEDLDVSGWHLSRSFFEYKYADSGTNFGMEGYGQGKLIPELNFNVALKRELLDAALANGVPATIALIMLFAILVTATKDEDESKMLGFNPAGVMRISSALFFVVLIAHIQLRERLHTEEFVFMEYLYFTVYLSLLLASLHTFLFLMKNVQVRFIEYENSLIPKLLFWPFVLGIQFVVTVLFFY